MENKQPQAVILSMTRDGEKLCAAGGRISTQPGDAIEIWNHSQDAEKNSRLIQKVTRSGPQFCGRARLFPPGIPKRIRYGRAIHD